MTTNTTLTRRVSTGIAATAMALGFAMVGAGSASADTISRPGERCSVHLSEQRGDLIVRIESNADQRRAGVEADFSPGRQGDDRKWVELRRGDGRTSFDIPRGARSVKVEVTIGDRRDRIKCDDQLRLRR